MKKMTRQERLKKLARGLEKMAESDARRLEEARRISELRRQAAAELHAICKEFVTAVNGLLSRPALELAPAEFSPEAYSEDATTLLQINASGRVVQITYRSTDTLQSTENLRTPYTLEGAVRWFNQELLDEQEIEEHGLYYCLERRSNRWVYVDPRTHRAGDVDMDYLTTLFEELVG